jgi:hypothetical protein
MGDMETTVDNVTTNVDTEIDTADTQDNLDNGVALLKKYKIDPENFTQEDLIATLDRLNRAESVKRDSKKKVVSDLPSDVMTKADYAMEKFLDKNPELSEYKSEIEKYTKAGLSLEDAKTLVLNSDKEKQNRDKTNSLGLSD